MFFEKFVIIHTVLQFMINQWLPLTAIADTIDLRGQ